MVYYIYKLVKRKFDKESENLKSGKCISQKHNLDKDTFLNYLEEKLNQNNLKKKIKLKLLKYQ